MGNCFRPFCKFLDSPKKFLLLRTKNKIRRDLKKVVKAILIQKSGIVNFIANVKIKAARKILKNCDGEITDNFIELLRQNVLSLNILIDFSSVFKTVLEQFVDNIVNHLVTNEENKNLQYTEKQLNQATKKLTTIVTNYIENKIIESFEKVTVVLCTTENEDNEEHRCD